MLLRIFLLFLGLSHAAILRSKDLQMNITQLLTLKDLLKTQLVDKKWVGIEKVFERITINAGLFENKQTYELVFETKENSWTQIELVQNLKVCRNFQNLIEEKNWDEVFLELISKMDYLMVNHVHHINGLGPFESQQKRLANEFCETLAHVVNGSAVHALVSLSKCHTHLLEILLKRSEIGPDFKNADGQTPLHTVADDFEYYCDDGHVNIDFVEILLKHGAKIDSTDNNSMTPLMIASMVPNISVVRTLLAHGANPNLADKHGKTCLHLATHESIYSLTQSNSFYTVREILDDSGNRKHKLEIDATDNEMRTPLMIAAKNGIKDAVWGLLHHGASPNLRDEYGKTALHYAAAKENKEMPYIVVFIPEVDTNDYYDDVAEILLEFKADPYTTDNQSQTPLMIAKNYNEWRMESLLNNARHKRLKQKLKQIKRKRKKLFPKQNLED